MTLSSHYWASGPAAYHMFSARPLSVQRPFITADLVLTLQLSLELKFTRINSDSSDLSKKTSLRARPTTAAFPGGSVSSGMAELKSMAPTVKSQMSLSTTTTSSKFQATEVVGILSQSLHPSPTIRLILPARIRCKAQNDVIFVGE